MSSLISTSSWRPVPVRFITVLKLVTDRHLVIWGKDLWNYLTKERFSQMIPTMNCLWLKSSQHPLFHILVSLPRFLPSLRCHRHPIQAWNTRSRGASSEKKKQRIPELLKNNSEIKRSHWHLSLSSLLYFSPSVDCLEPAHDVSSPSRYFKRLEKGLMTDRTVATHWCQSLQVATRAFFLSLTIIREKINPQRERKTNKTVTGGGNITWLQDVL